MIILPKGFDPTTWPKNFMGTGPWKLEKYTPNVGRDLHAEPGLLGHDAPPMPDRNEITFYEQGAGPRPRHPGRRGRRARAVLRRQRQGAADRPERQRHRAAAPRSTARCTCARTRSRSTTSASARRSRCCSTATTSSRACSRARPTRQRQPVRARLPVHRQDRAAAPAGRRAGQGAARRGRQERLRASSCARWDGFEVPQYAQLIQNDLKAAGIDVKLNITDAAHATTATRCTASRPGSTPRSASPTTATAACRTCSSARRCSSDGTWNCGALQEQGVRRSSSTDYIAAVDLAVPARGGEEDPGAAARRGADHLLLLLLLPLGDRSPPRRGRVVGDGPRRRHARRAQKALSAGRVARGRARHRPLPRQAGRPRA